MTASPNPRPWPAPDSPCPQCAPTVQNSFKAAFKAVSRMLVRKDLLSSLSYPPTQGRQSPLKKRVNHQQTTSIPHNSHQYHRDHGACGFLLVT